MKKILIPGDISKTQFFINQAYIDYIKNAGYMPIMAFSSMTDNHIKEALALCDGLLLPGGIDIDPIHYKEANYSCQGSNPQKDAFERGLLNSAIQANKPVFGICRGFQLMVREVLLHLPHLNDIFTYEQHISRHNGPNSVGISRKQKYHDVVVCKGALWKDGSSDKILQTEWVNSMHHQALTIPDKKLITKVKEKGKKSTTEINIYQEEIKILAYSDFGLTAKDDYYIVEAADIDYGGAKLRGVQWHPEELNDVALLHSFFGTEKQEEKKNET